MGLGFRDVMVVMTTKLETGWIPLVKQGVPGVSNAFNVMGGFGSGASFRLSLGK